MRRRFATDVRNVFDTQIAAGFAGLGAQSSYDTLLAEILDVRLAKSASFTRWDTRPLSPEQLAIRARGRRPPARARGGARTPPDRARPPGVGARGVPLPRAPQRRARPRHGVRAPAADSRPEPRRADDRARARGVARAHGRHRGPAGAEHPRRRPAGRARQAQAVLDQAARADPWRQRGEPAPPSVRDPRCGAPRQRTDTGAAAPGGPPAAAGPRGRPR